MNGWVGSTLVNITNNVAKNIYVKNFVCTCFLNYHLKIVWWLAAAAAKSLQSCLTLCDPIDGSPPGSAVPGILQARTLEWVAISFSSAWKWKVKGKSLSRVRLLATQDYSLPGSSIHGIFQARVLEWGATAFSEYDGLHNKNSLLVW